MLTTATKIVLVLALGATPILMTPRTAQAQTDAQQRAYQAGFQNGVNDRNQNKPLNLKTDNWRGQNLTAYQHGYEDGYRNRGGGPYGYNNRGYNNGYGHDGDHDRDDQGRGGWNTGYVGGPSGYGTTDAERRAYQAGFQNGQNDRSRNKPLNLKTDNWRGQNLTAYQRGYEDGYRRGYRH